MTTHLISSLYVKYFSLIVTEALYLLNYSWIILESVPRTVQALSNKDKFLAQIKQLTVTEGVKTHAWLAILHFTSLTHKLVFSLNIGFWEMKCLQILETETVHLVFLSSFEWSWGQMKLCTCFSGFEATMEEYSNISTSLGYCSSTFLRKLGFLYLAYRAAIIYEWCSPLQHVSGKETLNKCII